MHIIVHIKLTQQFCTHLSAIQLFITELRIIPAYAKPVLQRRVEGYMARAEQLKQRLNPLETAKAHAVKAIELDGQHKLDDAYEEYKKAVEALLKAVKMPHNHHLKPVSFRSYCRVHFLLIRTRGVSKLLPCIHRNF